MNTVLKSESRVEIKKQFPDLFQRFQRLKGIGGFLCVLGPDPRIRLFSRYDHVRRVILLTDLLMDRLGMEQNPRIVFLSYFHDINRLPFSYVSEKALMYDQALQLRPFLAGCRDNIPEKYVDDLEAIMKKDTESSFEARFVLQADMVVNFVEDLLFAAVLLDISAGELPGEILACMGFDEDEAEFEREVETLQYYFLRDVLSFNHSFHETAFKYMLRFIQRLGGEKLFLKTVPLEKSQTATVVKNYLKSKVFPVVDGEIVKDEALVQKIVRPYYCRMEGAGLNPFEQLWGLTDQLLLDTAVELNLVDAGRLGELWPELELMQLARVERA